MVVSYSDVMPCGGEGVPGVRRTERPWGRYITVTRKDDGTYRPNFKPLKVSAGFNVEHYATGVANELLWALEGLIENGSVEEESE